MIDEKRFECDILLQFKSCSTETGVQTTDNTSKAYILTTI